MLLFLNDLHLNCLSVPNATKEFFQYINLENPSASGLIIGGDISTSDMLPEHLKQISQGFPKPIYFVLGNHDYWGSSFARVDTKVKELIKKYPNLHWLNKETIILDNNISIVGVGGWYDAYYGNTNSKVILNDWFNIVDLMSGTNNRDILIQLIRERADQQAKILGKSLKDVCQSNADTILIVTHIPPYEEASFYKGEISDRESLPWYTSANIGAEIDRYAEHFPDKTFIVLCGHTHYRGIYTRRDNLKIYSGESRYGYPGLSGWLDIINKNFILY
jgi:predicted phosphohydrolase